MPDPKTEELRLEQIQRTREEREREETAGDVVDLLAAHHPGAARIGTVTPAAGRVGVPPLAVSL